jgi:acyl carrier protein
MPGARQWVQYPVVSVTQKRLLQLFVEQTGFEDATVDVALQELGTDSLDWVEFIVRIEAEYGVLIIENDILYVVRRNGSLGEALEVIMNRLESAPASAAP